jgi:superoxide dismutase, Cu-Zn family
MKQLILNIGVGIGLMGAAVAAAQSQATGTTGTSMVTASATLIDAEGRAVGQAYLRQAPHGVLLRLDLKNATPGVHGLHIHDRGRCDRPSFESAGGHFNPTNATHGFLNPRGPHAGDLPNIEVPSTTQESVEYFLPDVRIDGGPRSLADTNGSSIVIHEGKDDYATDPAGDSGHRLACGPIVRSGTK